MLDFLFAKNYIFIHPLLFYEQKTENPKEQSKETSGASQELLKNPIIPGGCIVTVNIMDTKSVKMTIE